ncbi:MAG TPA: HAD family phosphatase [Solirubrobacteraceae bacterium]|nr:HAD family phosphatase [Solirubrobacteraceae bacterium]
MIPVETIVCDFGGVLTSPLLEAFTAYSEASGIGLEALGSAMAAIAERSGSNPLFELETGAITEAHFLRTLEAELGARLGRPVSMAGFGEQYLAHLHPNEPMIELMRSLRERGLRMALCTNNVREWEPLWRAKLPVDEIFELVVDSGFVGIRKPDSRIYALTLERLGAPAETALLIDDTEINCDAAREFGMQAVRFRSNEQAIPEVERAVAR